MRKILPTRVKIKASGGIKNRKFAQELIQAGANRIGTSSGMAILEEEI
jgi:deoxyribose-phosphate aldolase